MKKDIQIENLQKQHLKEKVEIAKAFQRKLGNSALETIKKLVAERTRNNWREIAKKESSNSAEDIVRLLWEPMLKKGYQYKISTGNKFIQMQIEYCPLHKMAEELDVTEWAFYFHCYSDPYIVEGFNPSLKFRRTKTLMEGYDYCDHCYYTG